MKSVTADSAGDRRCTRAVRGACPSLFAFPLLLLLVAALSVGCGSPGDPALDDVAGTFWSGVDSDGDFYVYRFFPGGQFGYTSPTGTFMGAGDTWTQRGDSIRISINSGYSIRDGTIAGDQMAGTAFNQAGHTWTWTATRQGAL